MGVRTRRLVLSFTAIETGLAGFGTITTTDIEEFARTYSHPDGDAE